MRAGKRGQSAGKMEEEEGRPFRRMRALPPGIVNGNQQIAPFQPSPDLLT